MKKIHFLFGIHCHQPVGNFEHVFDESFSRCYEPFINMLVKHPKIKCTLHYTGPLLEWIEQHRKRFFEAISMLVARHQVEILSGGFYEPIITVIPPEDAIGQIRMLSEYVEEHFGYSPKGMWLAERVWEPALPDLMHDAGISYSILDDTHFRQAGLPEDEMFGYYVTEHNGKVLRLFPIDKQLRYLIPFRQPQEVIDYLKLLAENDKIQAVTMADDGEKFGVWPGTYDWVYNQGYLERFFTMLEENSEWVVMSTFSEYMESHNPQGKIYLPTSSYEEMMEWALPSPTIVQYEKVLHDLEKNEVLYKEVKPFYRGGFWRNFLAKYEESNLMHKKMLRISKLVHEHTPDNMQAKKELWRGQCNCPYWHGLFGGLYLNYLRNAIYTHLIKAEKIVDHVRHEDVNWVEIDQLDYQATDHKCVLISSSQLNAYVDPSNGGACFEIDYKPSNFNITNGFTRKFEAYHERLKHFLENRGKQGTDGEEPKSIHDIVTVKEEGLDKYLIYDTYSRHNFIDHFLPLNTTMDNFKQLRYNECGNFVGQQYKLKETKTAGITGEVVLERLGSVRMSKKSADIPVKLIKKIGTIDLNRLHVIYTLENRSDQAIELLFGCELNLSYLAAQSGDRYFLNEDGTRQHMDYEGTKSITFNYSLQMINEWDNIKVDVSFPRAVSLWRFPIATVSQSEGGFERTYQQTMIMPLWQIRLEPGTPINDVEVSLCFNPHH
ncbi:MAG: DUF1926 domain-containing protein [Candidatus Auribacter fodinae]|jgi:alpha-amylase|uniref:DUF1926 domain-containing protein n=1 Tax=Candidatus Auribacter fodinae TaxID=2093366 RepID=A0A3A4QZD4_9BACT|nr:MAG: DUF1926 domain-containing protein [Candidatus Auribacter fodinae]